MGDKDLLSDKVTIKQKCWIFNMKTAVKVTKGQIWSGTISKKLMSLGVLLVWKISYLRQTVQSWYYATLPHQKLRQKSNRVSFIECKIL